MDPEKARAVDEQYLQEALALRPEVASRMAAGGEADLPDPSPEGRAKLVEALSRWRDERDKISLDDRTFTVEIRQAALDHRVFSASLELLRFVEAELPQTKDPDRLSDVAGVIADQLYAPGDDQVRFTGIAGRLRGLDAYLKAAVVDVESPDPFLMRAAQRTVQRCHSLLDLILGRARAALSQSKIEETQVNDLEDAVGTGRAAVDDFGVWLQGVSPGEDLHRPGPDRFEQLLHMRGLDITAQEMAELGRSMAEEMRIEERRLARRAFKGSTPAEALAYARKQAPTSAAEAVAWFNELLGVARDAVASSGVFASLQDEDIDVTPAPPTIAGLLPTMHLISARSDGLDATPARLVMTIPGEEDYANISLADLENLVGAHAYPGRHLFSVCMNAYTTPARRGAPVGIAHPIASTWGMEASSGWAHHAEELMREIGFRDSPAARLITIRYGLYRAVLSLVDVGLSTGSFTREEAVQILSQNGGAAPEVAERDVVRCVRKPGWGLSALLGKMRLQQVRREAKVQWRHQYSDARFHELVLKSGAIPLTYLFELVDDPPPFDAPGDPNRLGGGVGEPDEDETGEGEALE
jgi:hypothetical protein